MNKPILDDSFGGFAPLVFLPNEATEHIYNGYSKWNVTDIITYNHHQ